MVFKQKETPATRTGSTAKQRKNFILDLVKELDEISVTSLAEQLGVSEMTIRRDLGELERKGYLKRVHGGAVSAHSRSYEPPFALRKDRDLSSKRLIGQFAAHMVNEGDSIALDVGSTVFEVARELSAARGLTVITPSLRVANLLATNRDIQTIVAGGIIRHGEESLVGDLAAQAFKSLFFDKLFLGVGGLDATNGLTEYNWDDALVKRAMIASARKVILVADSSKFDHSAFAKIGELHNIHALVTDASPPARIEQSLLAAGAVIHVVDTTEGIINLSDDREP
jgi:DeoR/GlpR family transcriptional regulator of sugar metabolism